MSTKRRETEEHVFDFVVVGGGTAGLAAAVAAARQGARTAIVQDRPVFGGNSSSEIRVAPLGSASFNRWSRETGILEEWLLEDRARNHDDIYDGMANSHYDIVLLESARAEKNLTLFMNTSIRGADTRKLKDGRTRITALHGSQLASEKELVFKAAQFADCTGDATVGFLAGADFRYGRDSRKEFKENMAPVKADRQTMGSTLTFRARNIGRPVPFNPPAWIKVYTSLDEIGPHRDPKRFNRVDYGGFWWIEVGSPFHQVDQNQEIRDELLAHVLGVWNYVKNYSDEKEEAANYALEWVGMLPGKRESRRLMGDVIMTEHDCHRDALWPDRVCYAGWFIDLHTMGGILNKKEPGEPAHSDVNYRNWTRVAPFSIPLRALYSRNVANLWMAGRNISVTHVALGATRVMMTHALQGQAVGTAAARAIRHSLTARDMADPAGDHIKAIQQQLLRDDVHVFDCPNSDPDDLARGAAVTATSDAPLTFGEPLEGQGMELTAPQSQVFPVTHDHIDTVSVFLRNRTDKDVTIAAQLCEQARIWDRSNGPATADCTFTIKAGAAAWCEAAVNAAVKPGRPCRLWLEAAPGVEWSRAAFNPTGTVAAFMHRCPGGCEPKNLHMNTLLPHETDLPKYELWTQYRFMALSLRITPVPQPYGAESVNNGTAWPLAMPNLWVSDPSQSLPQSVTLTFPKPAACNTAVFTFDTHLDYPYHSMGAFWKAHTCASDWKLHARVSGAWQEVSSGTGNYKRKVTARFQPVKAEAFRLEILATNRATAEATPADNPVRSAEIEQARSARVYEIRVYNE